MTNVSGSAKAPCVNCRETVEVSERYAQGDHIRCGACGTDHKILRGDRVRIVLADVGPLREALTQNQQLVSRLESDLARARGSIGIGANGGLIGVGFAVYQVAINGADISTSLIVGSVLVALVTGALLEGTNWLFLAKRQKIDTLSREIEEARADASRLRAQIRDATRT
jgi:hypothetical protein